MLNPRSIAVGGIGYGARAVAVLGLWPSEYQPEQLHDASSIGSRRRTALRRDDDDLVDRVLDKWEAIERASLSPGYRPAETIQDGRRVPPESSTQPDLPAIDRAFDQDPPIARAASDVALAPLAPDVAKAAIEARRKNNEAALLMLLMDL